MLTLLQAANYLTRKKDILFIRSLKSGGRGGERGGV